MEAKWTSSVYPLPFTIFLFYLLNPLSAFGNQLDCPPATLKIQKPGILCPLDEPFQLELKTVGLYGDLTITWSGDAVIDPSGIFDPGVGYIGANTIYVTVQSGICTYTDSIGAYIQMRPIAAFQLTGAFCVDSILQTSFSGYTYYTPYFYYEFPEAQAELIDPMTHPLNIPDEYALIWSTPGERILSLWIDRMGCNSDTFYYPITIGQHLEAPKADCVIADLHSLTVGWPSVDGAESYLITNPFGSDTITTTYFTLDKLPDNTTVDFQITALSKVVCGSIETTTIQCRTQEYIESHIYAPNVFSPNQDGTNDIFYLQSNASVAEVNVFRIFDRWGNKVFEDFHFPPNDPGHGWDGKRSGKWVNPGVFTYQVNLKSIYGENTNLNGEIALVR